MDFIKFCHFVTNLIRFCKLYTCISKHSCLYENLRVQCVSPPRVSVSVAGGGGAAAGLCGSS